MTSGHFAHEWPVASGHSCHNRPFVGKGVGVVHAASENDQAVRVTTCSVNASRAALAGTSGSGLNADWAASA